MLRRSIVDGYIPSIHVDLFEVCKSERILMYFQLGSPCMQDSKKAEKQLGCGSDLTLYQPMTANAVMTFVNSPYA